MELQGTLWPAHWTQIGPRLVDPDPDEADLGVMSSKGN